MDMNTRNTHKSTNNYLHHFSEAEHASPDDAGSQTDAALQEEINKKNTLLAMNEEIAGTGSYEWNLQTNKVHCSSNFLAMLGLNPDSFDGNPETLISCTHEKDQPLVRQLIDKMLVEKKAEAQLNFPTSRRVVLPDGNLRIINSKSDLLFDREGNVTHVIGIIHDITSQVENQQALETEKALLESTEKIAKIGSWEYDVLNNKVTWSKHLYDILQVPYSPEAPSYPDGQRKIFGEENFQWMETYVIDAVTKSKPYNFEITIDLPDGTLHYFNVIGEVRENDRGLVTHVYGSFQDVTGIKAAREQLQDSKRNYKNIAESVPGVVLQYKLNPDGTDELLYLNQRVEEIHEIPRKEALKDISLMWKAIHPNDVEGFTKSVQQSAETLNPWEIEFRIITRSGKTKWLRGSGTPKKLPGGSVIWDTILLDITSLKQVAQDLLEKNVEIEEINQQLRVTNEQLDTFVYRVSHDLRAPIASSIGLTQLSLHSNDADEIHRYDEMELKSLTRLDNFIQDILNFSRNARIEVAREPINFSQTIEQIIDDHQAKINETGIKISYKVNGATTFISDNLRIQIILKNLISNAIKYQQPNSDNPQVSISVTINNTQATITIADNGIGIRKEHQPDIFKMFYRATELNVGSGLGLYIVKDCVDKLKGTLSFNSEYRKGSTFTVVLPYSNANQA